MLAFTSLTFVDMLSLTFFTNVRVHIQHKICFCESCKYAYFDIQNRHGNVGNKGEYYVS
jgi:hypothetical protein